MLYASKNLKLRTQNLRLICNTVFQLLFHRLEIQIAANANELNAGCSWPFRVFELKPLACELKKVASGTLLKPEDALHAEQL